MSDITNIKNWLEAKLKEDDNDPDNLSIAKFNERRWHTMAKKEEEDQKNAEVAKKRVSEPIAPPKSCANSKRPSKSLWSSALKEKEKEKQEQKCMGWCATGAWSAGWIAWPEWVGRPWCALPVKTQRPSANGPESRAERRRCAGESGLWRSR